MKIKQIINFNRKHQNKITFSSLIIGLVLIFIGAGYFGAKLHFDTIARVLSFIGLAFIAIGALNVVDSIAKTIEGKKGIVYSTADVLKG